MARTKLKLSTYYISMLKLSDINSVHFIGAGGISLSALAKLMLKLGKKVSGSDICYSQTVMELNEEGARIWIGNQPRLLSPLPDLAVYSSAVPQYDKELVYCRLNNVPTMERHEFLALCAKEFECVIAIGGTHGKTTACALTGHIFKCAQKSFCAHIGGDALGMGNLYYTGKEYFITEACEYKKSLLSLSPHIAVVLNAEIDHPDTYADIEEIYAAFDAFLFSDKNRLALANSDSVYYKQHLQNQNSALLTFGTSEHSDFILSDIQEYADGYFSFSLSCRQSPLLTVKLSIPGIHNIYNASAAIAVSYMLNIPPDTIKEAAQSFKGVRRRFEYKGMLKGADIFHDYAHHPSEIRAVIDCAKKLCKGRLLVVFQPHTFSRTSALFDDFATAFNRCDEVYLVREYSARENGCQGKSAYELFKKLHNKNSYYFDDFITLAKHLVDKLSAFDMLVVMGAGDIVKLCDLLV